ncbi:hypothetical protein Clacol_004533 [Clathrus columnatus]|uniref:Uncharacterized protein n=1 Tax=Clathrus columnatus TaxID=1419009 RepID=A0AAV5A6S0_9AGAM|nr:hypothetical protein Clacol_004533 [Clathrus columnatus]
MKEIITMFDNLLQTEGHRIKFLYLVEDRLGKLSRAVLGKALPVLKTFIFDETNPPTEESDLLKIIKGAKSLENLNINLWRTSIPMSSLEIKEQIYISILPYCYKLESLIVIASPDPLDDLKLSSVITLTNLISLKIDCYALVHKLRAPSLRRLSSPQISELKPDDDHDYLIFDDYDISPVTELCVSGCNILALEGSWIIMNGLPGPKSCDGDPWTPFERARYKDYNHVDLRRDTIDASSASPTQFYIGVPTYHIPNIDGVAPPDLRPSPVLSKIFSKLHNLEILYITPFIFEEGHVPRFSKSILESLRTFLKIIFDNLISSKIKQLCIWKVGRSVKILRLIFNLVDNCSALSNLDTIKLGTYGYWRRSDVSIHKFAEELVNSLQLRQKAGYRALPRIGVDWQAPLPKKCIAEAAVLGTQIVQCGERISLVGRGVEQGRIWVPKTKEGQNELTSSKRSGYGYAEALGKLSHISNGHKRQELSCAICINMLEAKGGHLLGTGVDPSVSKS